MALPGTGPSHHGHCRTNSSLTARLQSPFFDTHYSCLVALLSVTSHRRQATEAVLALTLCQWEMEGPVENLPMDSVP